MHDFVNDLCVCVLIEIDWLQYMSSFFIGYLLTTSSKTCINFSNWKVTYALSFEIQIDQQNKIDFHKFSWKSIYKPNQM